MASDRLHHDGDDHAGARHHDRQRRPALHARLALDDPGPDQLGPHLLHRRRRDHDLAARLDGDALRPQEAVHRLHRRLHPGLDAVRRRAHDRADGRLPAPAGRVRRGAGAAEPGGDARHLSPGPARLGDGDLGHGGDARPDHGPDARRLSHRFLFLALGVLRQPAIRNPHHCRLVALHERDPDPARRALLLVRLPQPFARHRGIADDARPRRAARLVRCDRDLDRGNPCRRRLLFLSRRLLHLRAPVHHRPDLPRLELLRSPLFSCSWSASSCWRPWRWLRLSSRTCWVIRCCRAAICSARAASARSSPCSWSGASRARSMRASSSSSASPSLRCRNT